MVTITNRQAGEQWLQNLRPNVQAAVRSIPVNGLVAFIVTLLTYAISMPRDLTWSYFGGDGGELITASVTLGIPHPPGYPLYVLLGNVFSNLPFGTIAFRYHLFSAFCMALAVAFISETGYYHYTKMKGGRVVFYLPGVIAALFFAFFPVVWSQGIIAEVYALNLAVLSAMVWALLTGRSPLLVGLLFGVSITTHLTSLLMLPMNLLWLGRKNWRAFAIGTAIGLLPLAILGAFAMGDSPVIWGRPGTLRDWAWLLSAWLYRPNILNLAPGSWIGRLQSWLLPFLIPFSILLVFLFNGIRHKRLNIARKYTRVMFLTAVIYILYAGGYSTQDAIVLVLPAILLLVMLIAISLTPSRFSILALVLMVGFGSLYLINEKGAPVRHVATETIYQVPERSIVVTPGDPTISAVWYFSYAERLRQDLIVVDYNLFQFDWYRDHLWEATPNLTRVDDDDINAFIAANSGNFVVCQISLYHVQTLECGLKKLKV